MFSLYLVDIIRVRKQVQKEEYPSLKSTLSIAIKFSPLWFIANYFYNSSLNLTSISSATIISSTSGLFTLIISIKLQGTSPDFCKFIAALLTLSGVIIISIEDVQSESDSFVGDLIALISAIFYSLYCVYLSMNCKKVYLPHLFAFVGLVILLSYWPFFLFLHFIGAEGFELPSGEVLGFLLINGFFGTVLSDLLWATSIKMLNPTICTLAISLTIPLSVLVDVIINGKSFTVVYFVGGSMIVMGFFIISLFEHPDYGKLISNEGLRLLLAKKPKVVNPESKIELGTFSD